MKFKAAYGTRALPDCMLTHRPKPPRELTFIGSSLSRCFFVASPIRFLRWLHRHHLNRFIFSSAHLHPHQRVAEALFTCGSLTSEMLALLSSLFPRDRVPYGLISIPSVPICILPSTVHNRPVHYC